jgi:hypothetical protein
MSGFVPGLELCRSLLLSVASFDDVGVTVGDDGLS